MPQQRSIVRYVVACVCLFHILAVMGYLVREGRLSIVPIYDDVAYLVDGLKRLAVLDRSGIGGFLLDLGVHPAHSPFSALASTFGFLLSGGAVWGPYLLNSAWVFIAAGLALAALRDLDAWARIGIIVAILAAPIFGGMVTEFRPDPVWGLLVGLSVAIMATIDIAHAPSSRLFILGLLFGAAILAKPTAAPASVVVLGVGFTVQLGLSLINQADWSIRSVARKVAIVILGTGLFVAPYIVTSGREILAYVLAVMGSESEVWKTNTSTFGHLTYYLNQNTGVMMLGWIWYLAIPILLFCTGVLAYAKERRALCAFAGMISALLVAYTIVTVSEVKTPMIGSILYGTIIATVVWSLGYIAGHVPIHQVVVFFLGAVIFITQWTPRGIAGPLRTNPAMIAVDEASKAAFPVVLQALRSGPKTVLFTVPGPVYDATLDFFARQQGISSNFVTGYTWNTWEMFSQGVAAADVVVLSEAGMLGQALGGFSFPSVQFQERLLNTLRANTAFTGKSVFTDDQGRSVWVFVRVKPPGN
ncbi:hypothetical protein J7E70_00180 [Variovorax paradoxus]|nr:hypothetical protein [Variovorax paradoxus]MBT2298869.1 hypothetical protein [Variovorax paradoxus]